MIMIMRGRELGTKSKSLEHDTVSSHRGRNEKESKLDKSKTSQHCLKGIHHEHSVHIHSHVIVRNDRKRQQHRTANVQRYASSSPSHHDVQQAVIHKPRESADRVR